ncbi:hypothetical protein BDW59DRAFT_43173 [Aspergillus cavernicola]|uniref:HNH nuclease domain-containing protein n=1 Tax=Aspergillus cavernicola TaxID=176166 RepID=A0ABR4ILS5_9EURO
MSSPLRLIDEDEESENEGTLEVTFHYLDCFDLDEPVGVERRRNRDGEIVPSPMGPFGLDIELTIDRAIAAAGINVAAADRRRRPRIPPVRPPRPPRPIYAWDELVGGGNTGSLVAELLERELRLERQAAEIVSPRDIDDEPDPTTWPTNWGIHHDYFLWACRGSVTVITDHIQAVFAFNPPIEERFVSARLGGVNAYKQLTFLSKHLPGETHSMQRAVARGVLYEADISDPDVRDGIKKLDVKQAKSGTLEYIEPILPCWAPHNWNRADDAFAAMYIGDHPNVFLREYGFVFREPPSDEFVRIRMAQIPHLNLSWTELMAAQSRRQLLSSTFPSQYFADNNNPLPNFF